MKRIFCMLLALLCMFSTGCNSIIYKGNISFKAYEPETVPAIGAELEDKIDETEEADFQEKYAIEGTDAFYILPKCENRPEEILDFKVLDYASNGRFIYAYLTPYYGEEADAEALSGTAGTVQKKEREAEAETEAEAGWNITVLMSYDPFTGDYTVFYTNLSSRALEETVTHEDTGEGLGDVTATASGSLVMANSLVKREEYFIFDEQAAYVFDKDGTELYYENYSSVIANEIARLKQKAVAAGTSSSDAERAEISILDVVMDGYYYVYIPITIEIPQKEAGEEMTEEDYEEQAENAFSSVIACYTLDIGGEKSSIRFLSSNDSREGQEALWKSLDGNYYSSWSEMEIDTEAYSLDKIKSGETGGIPDLFSAFHTDSSINMELAAIPDLLKFSLTAMNDSHEEIRTVTFAASDLMLCFLDEYAAHWFTELSRYFLAQRAWWMVHGSNTNFWRNVYSPRERERTMAYIKGLVVMMAQGDAETIKQAGSPKGTSYYMIPWVTPGAWDSSTGRNPSYVPPGTYAVEAMFAYRTSVYHSGRISRYSNIEFDRRYELVNGKPNYPNVSVEVTKWTEPMSRTLYYYEERAVEEDTEDTEEGSEAGTELVLVSYTENVPGVPLEYRMIFPEKTMVSWVEEIDTGELPAASGDMGALYYTDTEAGTAEEGEASESVSRIRYNNGGKDDILSDQEVPGRARDAGILYYEDQAGTETELAVLLTDEGIKFYRRTGINSFDTANALFLTQKDMAQAMPGYGVLRQGQITRTDESEEELLQTSEEEDQIIDANMESGSSLDAFSISNFTLFNSQEILISSLTNGLLMTNLSSGLTISLEPGVYYAAFPYVDQDSSSRKYMTVGYQTEEFSYQPGDVAWAKCYSIDVDTQHGQLQTEAIKAYLDSLVGDYLTRRYRFNWSEEEGAFQKAEPTSEEKTEDKLAEQLFYSETEENTKAILKTQVLDRLGVTSNIGELEEYALAIRKKLLDQDAAMKEFYHLVHFEQGDIEKARADVDLLQREGLLISANYADTLEMLLVDLALSDHYISELPAGEKKIQYEGYQKQKEEMEKLNSRDVDEAVYQEGKIVGSAAELERSLDSLSKMDFYKTVLEDIRLEWEARQEAVLSWEEYLEDLLKRVSPDNAINQRELGLEEFCSLAGFSSEVVDLEVMAEEISVVNRVVGLEEIIVKYKLKQASYQSSSYKKEYADFVEKVFSTEKERDEAFRSAEFYQIIQELIDTTQTETTDAAKKASAWEDKLTEILGKCGAGIVLGREG